MNESEQAPVPSPADRTKPPPGGDAGRDRLRRKPFRFSLATLLLVMIGVLLASSHFLTSLRLHHARREIQRLRAEAGYLDISDPSKVHAIGVPTYQDMLWKWKVYLPPGEEYELHSCFGEIPPTGFPSGRGSEFPLEAGGEMVLVVSLYRDHRGKWRQKIAWDQGTLSSAVTSDIGERAWLQGHLNFSSQGVGTTQVDQAPQDELVLVRLRVNPKMRAGVPSPSEPADGLMLWIAPAEK